MISSFLPAATCVLVVCAHPDDESFGLGAVLTGFLQQGARTAVLCFTHGEASTLQDGEGDLDEIRPLEFIRAAHVLGVSSNKILDYADGRLGEQPTAALVEHIVQMAREVGADLLLTFDEGGITGHPDHERATSAAVQAASVLEVSVLGWAVVAETAAVLNHEFGSNFVGRRDDELDFRVASNRDLQREAIACHQSQSASNPVLQRRLELSGNVEPLRWLTQVPHSRNVASSATP